MICCELFLKTISRILDHPATSDPQKWLYEILKILQMLLAFNISDPLKWLDDILWTLPETLCRILEHPATSDPQKWLYEILKILQIFLASNISDPLKWLDDMLWTLPVNRISDPRPSNREWQRVISTENNIPFRTQEGPMKDFYHGQRLRFCLVFVNSFWQLKKILLYLVGILYSVKY